MSQTKAQLVSGTTAQDLTVDNINTTSVNSGQLSNRNIIINGAMEVAQRGTSFTGIDNTAQYPVDRFFMANSTGSARHTGTQDTDSPANFKNSIKSNCTTASSGLTSNSLDQFKIEYRVEEKGFEWVQFGTANAQALTLSFYIKSSQTGDTAVALVNSDNTRSFVHKFTISSTDWQRVTVNVPGDTGSNWHNGVIGIRIRWGSFGTTYQTSTFDQWQGAQKMTTNSNQINFAAATGNTLQITGVQLEPGSTATDFQHRSFAEELKLCERYYQQISRSSAGNNSTNGSFGAGTCNNNAGNGGIMQVSLMFQTKMRAAPTMSDSGTFSFHVSGVNVADTSTAYSQSFVDGVRITATQTAFVANNGVCGELISKYSDTSTAIIKASAEL
tara:strand:+ start:5 stop:1162 length:1158 start_codon:yes stop_codon:yes gene_type:complete